MARILVVDDEPLNRQLLRACFANSGHAVVEARDGHEALIAAQETPDLVLLDVMMPGMDGFECVRRLRVLFDAEPVPIVLVTALDDREAKMTGLAAGADELLTKPIDRDELLARAGNLLALRARDLELQRRMVELAELRRFQDDTMAMIVHDLRSPLSVIQSSIDAMIGRVEVDPSGEAGESLIDCRRACARMSRLVGNILEIAAAESGRLNLRVTPGSLAPLVDGVIAPRRAALQRRSVDVSVDVTASAEVDRDLITRVIENLIDNAARHTPQGGRMRVWTTETPEGVDLRIGNSGSTIPESSRALVFEKYTQVWDSKGAGSVGLGLYFCRLAVEAHGGSIWIEETAELPTVLALRLPVQAVRPALRVGA